MSDIDTKGAETVAQGIIGNGGNARGTHLDVTSEEDIKKLTDISAQSMKGMRSMAMSMGTGGPDEPLYSNLIMAIQVDDAEA